jgi:hypothetical protein
MLPGNDHDDTQKIGLGPQGDLDGRQPTFTAMKRNRCLPAAAFEPVLRAKLVQRAQVCAPCCMPAICAASAACAW